MKCTLSGQNTTAEMPSRAQAIKIRKEVMIPCKQDTHNICSGYHHEEEAGSPIIIFCSCSCHEEDEVACANGK